MAVKGKKGSGAKSGASSKGSGAKAKAAQDAPRSERSDVERAKRLQRDTGSAGPSGPSAADRFNGYAVIAMAGVLAVVRPHMNGVGGDAFGIFYDGAATGSTGVQCGAIDGVVFGSGVRDPKRLRAQARFEYRW